MTESLFALVFVLALRLHLSGRVNAGMWTASLMILARPEGFFLGILWGVWILLDRRDPRPMWRQLPSTLGLAAGFALWWLASLLITRNPLFILHDWPGTGTRRAPPMAPRRSGAMPSACRRQWVPCS